MSRRLRQRLRRLAVRLTLLTLRVLVRALSRVVPQDGSVVVSCFPATEGNGIEVARALCRRYEGRVVWLTEGTPPHEVDALRAEGLVLVPKASALGVWRYLRAQCVFFTHGLYGSPRPTSRKPLVNLWHGDGPKQTRPDDATGSLIPSTYLVGSTELFTGLKGKAFEVPDERLLITGNPRTDQFWRDVDGAALAGLGLTDDFVLWMPTFRRTRVVGAVTAWSESASGATETGPSTFEPLVEGLRRRGLQLVVKPHPMDAEARSWDGVLTVSDDDLRAAGLNLYAVIGHSRGLVTDYSSVWVDYLLLDRPVAFLTGDEAAYRRALVPADVLSWLPGERVDASSAPFAEFLDDLDAQGRLGADLRARVARRIGLCPSRTSADDLLTELAGRAGLRVGDPDDELSQNGHKHL